MSNINNIYFSIDLCYFKVYNKKQTKSHCPVCGSELPPGMNSCPTCNWRGGKK